MTNNNILLLSEDRLKTYTSLNDNCFGKNILPAIRTSQDIELTTILGSCLVDALKSMVADGSIQQDANYYYKYLLDNYVTEYLAYITLAHLITELSTKLTNFGTVESNDEHLVNVSLNEREIVRQQYEYYADAYCKKMQGYLKANRERFPELECGCDCGENISPTLDSAASTGLFLGGRRGIKGYRRFYK